MRKNVFNIDISLVITAYKKRLFFEVVALIVIAVVYVIFFQYNSLGIVFVLIPCVILAFDATQYSTSKQAASKLSLELKTNQLISHSESSYGLFYKDLEIKDVKMKGGNVEHILLMNNLGQKIKLKNFERMDDLLCGLKEKLVTIKGAGSLEK